MIPQSAASVLIRHVSAVSGGLDPYITLQELRQPPQWGTGDTHLQVYLIFY